MSEAGDRIHVSGSMNGNFHCTWIIPKFSFLNYKIGDKTDSESFQLDAYPPRWNLRIYPGGAFRHDYGFVSCYLKMSVDSDPKSLMNIEIKPFTFHNSAGRELWNHKCSNHVVTGSTGCDRIMPRDALIEKLVGDVLIISVSVSYSNTFVVNGKDAEYPSDSTPNKQLVKHYESLLRNAKTADIELLVGSKVIPVHSVILRARSKVFDEMFQHDVKLKDHRCLEITDLGKDIVDSFLQFVYTGNIVVMDVEKALELLGVADKYKMFDLEHYTRNFLISRLNDENAAAILIHADRYKASRLRLAVLKYFEAHGKREMLLKHRSILESRVDLLYDIIEYTN